MATTEASARGMRADAQRNRERIIAAAIEVFAESGLEASTAEVAHRAGVGEATLFRRFPSKDALIEAIVETQMDGALAIAADCLEDPDPGHGLERFLLEMVERSVADRGVLEATKNECVMNTNFDERRKRFLDLAAALVRRAQRAGAVREDLSGQDLGILIGFCSSTAELPFPACARTSGSAICRSSSTACAPRAPPSCGPRRRRGACSSSRKAATADAPAPRGSNGVVWREFGPGCPYRAPSTNYLVTTQFVEGT